MERVEEPDSGGGEVALAGGGRRRRVLVVSGVAVALIAAALLVGRWNGAGTGTPTTTAPSTPATTVTSAAPTVTTAAPTTTTASQQAGTGPVLGPGTTGTLWALVRSAPNDVVRVDLATGDVSRHRLGLVVAGQSWLLASAGGALVASGANGGWVTSDLAVTEFTPPQSLLAVAASPISDEAWAEAGEQIGERQLVHLRRSTGEVLGSYSFANGTLVGVGPAGEPLVAANGGGTFALDAAANAWHRVSSAAALLVDHGMVVEHACDDVFVCVDQVRELATGEHHSLQPVEATPGFFFELALAPVGGAVAAMVDTGPNGVRLVVWGPDGQILAQRDNVTPNGSSPEMSFTPDGMYLFYADGTGLHVVPLAGPVDVAAAAESKLSQLLGSPIVAAAVASAG